MRAVIIALVCLIASVLAYEHDYSVLIEEGTVIGTGDDTKNIKAFRGIPFGEDTSGSNRFMPPLRRKPWSSPLTTKEFAPGCSADGAGPNVPSVTSEDCLYLNVFSPLNFTGQSEGKTLPVMVFFYGGGFSQGSSDGPFGMYDGTFVAGHEEVVVVTVNYRLSGLGFFTSDTVPGNMGLLDQQLALKWVQRNILAFSGDKDKVTVYGESAGAMSIGLHATMPSSKGLFKRAIMQSNPMGLFYTQYNTQQLFGAEACRLSGCLVDGRCDMPCMQQVPLDLVKENLSASIHNMTIYIQANLPHPLDGILGWKPVVDGSLVPQEVLPAFEAGAFHQDVDYLVGSNTDESFPFLYGKSDVKLTYPEFAIAISLLFGKEKGAAVSQFYYEQFKDDGMAAVARAVTDWWFRCAVQKVPTAVKQFSDRSAYVYKYDHIFSQPELWTRFGFPKQCENGVCHASELLFTFAFFEATLSDGLHLKMTDEEKALSKHMVHLWANFAKTGNPNVGTEAEASMAEMWELVSPKMRGTFSGLRGTVWDQWDANTRNNIVFNTGSDSTENSKELCEMWDTIGYHFGAQTDMLKLIQLFTQESN